MNRVQRLYNLQLADQEWEEKGRRYQVVRATLGDQSELTRLRSSLDTTRHALAAIRARQRDSELEYAGVQSKQKTVHESLYSGRVLIPKDLETLQKEDRILKQRLSSLEEGILGMMSQAEELEQKEKESSAALSTYESDQVLSHANLTQEYTQLRTRLRELQDTRETLRVAIERNDLSLYEELRGKKNGVVLAPIANSSCQICRVTVPTRKASLAQTGDDIVLCEGCGRILYLA